MAVILSPRGNEASNMMKRFVRYEEAAQYFGIDETLIVAYAKAAGAVYQLSKIRLIKIEPLEDYMKWAIIFNEMEWTLWKLSVIVTLSS